MSEMLNMKKKKVHLGIDKMQYPDGGRLHFAVKLTSLRNSPWAWFLGE